MKDIQAHLEKLRVQLAECALIRDLATDEQKRELFARLTEHLKALIKDIEQAMVTGTADAFLGRKTQEPPTEMEE